jgi:hypothetical protein
MYLLLTGEFDIANRNADGSPAALQEMGEAPTCEMTIEEQRAENYATGGTLNEKDLSVTVVVDVKGALTVKEAGGDRLSLAVFGSKSEEAGGPVVAQAFPAGIAEGEKHFLPGRPLGVSALTIVDSAGSPETLEEGTDYTADLDFGTVKFLNVDGFTQPFKASYTKSATENVAIATTVTPEKFFFMRGKNLANEEKAVVVEMYRTRFGPAKKVTLKTADKKEVSAFEYDLEFLADPTKPRDPVLGRYGRLRYV